MDNRKNKLEKNKIINEQKELDLIDKKGFLFESSALKAIQQLIKQVELKSVSSPLEVDTVFL